MNLFRSLRNHVVGSSFTESENVEQVPDIWGDAPAPVIHAKQANDFHAMRGHDSLPSTLVAEKEKHLVCIIGEHGDEVVNIDHLPSGWYVVNFTPEQHVYCPYRTQREARESVEHLGGYENERIVFVDRKSSQTVVTWDIV